MNATDGPRSGGGPQAAHQPEGGSPYDDTRPLDSVPPREDGRRRGGRILFGLVLVAIGVAWLLVTTEAVDIDWEYVLPGALIVIGVGVLATARSGGHGGLIGLGVVISILAILSTLVSPSFTPEVLAGGIGDRVEQPEGPDGDTDFTLAIGELTVDLRDTQPLPREVSAAVGIGHLVVYVPEDVDVALDASVGAGEISVPDETRNGVGVDLEQELPGGASGERTLTLEAAVSLGQLEVRR